MRVLILTTLLACVSAAPSAPVLYASLLAPAAIPIAVPTVSPGDLQAAAIDAQVKAEDQARAFTDQAREMAEIAAENQNAGVMEANDMTKERSDLAFWNAEEEKQRMLDAERTAAAEAEAAMAARAYVHNEDSSMAEAPASPEQPMPEAAVKAAEAPATQETPMAMNEAPKAEEQMVKMAEPEPAMAVMTEKPADSVQVESANLKSEPIKMDNMAQPEAPQTQTLPHQVLASVMARSYNQPIVAPYAFLPPGVQLASPVFGFPHGNIVPVLQRTW